MGAHELVARIIGGWWLVVLQGSGTSVTGNPLFDSLLGLGVVGIVFILAALGYIWFKPAVTQLQQDKAALQATNSQFLLTYEDKVIPALHEAITAMGVAARASAEQTAEIALLRQTITSQNSRIDTLTTTVGTLQTEIARLRGPT